LKRNTGKKRTILEVIYLYSLTKFRVYGNKDQAVKKHVFSIVRDISFWTPNRTKR